MKGLNENTTYNNLALLMVAYAVAEMSRMRWSLSFHRLGLTSLCLRKARAILALNFVLILIVIVGSCADKLTVR